jgi:PAS domain S-box-containing protein
LTPESLSTAVDHAAAPIIITDTLGRIAYANRAAADLIGRPLSRVRGRHFAMLMADEGPLPEIDTISALVASGRTWSGALSTRREDGSLVRIGLLLTPVHSKAGEITHSIAVLREVEREGDAGQGSAPAMATAGAAPAITDAPDVRQPLPVLAGDVAEALLALEGVIGGLVIAFGAGDRGEVLAERRMRPITYRDTRIPPARVREMRTRALEGAWIEPSSPARAGGRGSGITCPGARAVAYAPLRHGSRIVGLLAVATDDPLGATALERHLVALSHFGVLASGLLGPGIAAREQEADLRTEIGRVIADRAFVTVFQPMVRLADGEPFAFEALTRFIDGTPPERRFIDAQTIGLGADMELATLSAAFEAAEALPAGASLSVNMSPGLVLQHDRLAPLFRRLPRPTIVEVTEREPIDDYVTFRRAMARLDKVAWAVDDAGAGYSSLRHIIEIRPDYVKLDQGLVHAIPSDPVRQALAAGMLHFATSIGVRIIAEGVETDAERLTLQALGVEFGQGYLFGHPAPIGGSLPADHE